MKKFDAERCEAILGYRFKDKKLLEACFTHSTYHNEHKEAAHNERLEFLGDSVLGLIVSEYLFKSRRADEGKLTIEKQKIVSTVPLAECAKKLGLHEMLLLGNGQRVNETICENLYEAVVAGIYLDGGRDEAENFVKRTLLSSPHIDEINYIGDLQEKIVKDRLGKIDYELIDESGPDHDKIYTYRVYAGETALGEGSGASKAKARAAAAKAALKNLDSRGQQD